MAERLNSRDQLDQLLDETYQIGRSLLERSSVEVARELVGTIVVTKHPSGIVAGRVVETEAYPGDEPASHAYNKVRPTQRTKAQYLSAGHLYVYKIMGLHTMTSIVTNKEGVPDVVFIRSMEPLFGIELMRERRGFMGVSMGNISTGPGKLSRALGITTLHNGFDIFSEDTFISLFNPIGESCRNKVKTGKRINLGTNKLGSADAGSATNAQLRFFLPDSKFLST
jgi:DNA-3-methyladenine glycosylase